VFERPFQRELYGTLPNGEAVTVTVRVTATAPFLILKGLALFDRRARKDAYDIYHRLKNYPGGITELVEEFSPCLSLDVVWESLDKIGMLFASVKSEGPRFVAAFLDPSAREERDYIERDSYELVHSLLEALRAK
jgi:hypothetical protein